MNLSGRTILITRPQPGCDETALLVTRHGGLPLKAPVMRIVPPLDGQPFIQAMTHLDRFDAVLLTSANSAKAFVAAMPADIIPPPVFAVGQKTARILAPFGWNVTVPDHPEGGETLGQAILQSHPQAQRFLFPRAEEGREELHQLLEKAGKEVTVVTAYRTAPILSLPEDILVKLPQVDAITFFSPRTVEIFLALLPEGRHSLPPSAAIAALSPLTAKALQDRGVHVDVIAIRPESEGILHVLGAYWKGQGLPSHPT